MTESLTAEMLSELKAIRGHLEAAAKPPAELLDRADLAAALNVGGSTLDKLKARGAVGPAAVRIGGGIRWRADEVRAWLANPTPAGELYDSQAWPAIWADFQRRAAKK